MMWNDQAAVEYILGVVIYGLVDAIKVILNNAPHEHDKIENSEKNNKNCKPQRNRTIASVNGKWRRNFVFFSAVFFQPNESILIDSLKSFNWLDTTSP